MSALDPVGLDLLLADLLGDLAVLGDGLGAQAHALLGDRLLVDDDLVLVQHDLVLLLGDGRAVQRVVAVGVGDRLTLDPDLLVLNRDGLGDHLGDDVLAQPRPAGLTLTRADRAAPPQSGSSRHRCSGRWCRDPPMLTVGRSAPVVPVC